MRAVFRTRATTWGVLTFGILFVVAASGCNEKQGWSTSVVDSSGQPIPGATVSVVPLPPGGVQEVAQMVRAGQSLFGWHFTTDQKGKCRLDGIPTGGYTNVQYHPPVTTTYGGTYNQNTYANGSAYGSGGAYAYGSAYGTTQGQWQGHSTTPGQVTANYAPGQPLGLVVRSPGRRPYVGFVEFAWPRGKLGKITIYTEQGNLPDYNLRGGKVTLSAG